MLYRKKKKKPLNPERRKGAKLMKPRAL